jgi:hypothetical protein
MTFRILAAIAAMLSVSAAATGQDKDDLDAGAKLPVAESHVTAVLSATHARRLLAINAQPLEKVKVGAGTVSTLLIYNGLARVHARQNERCGSAAWGKRAVD